MIPPPALPMQKKKGCTVEFNRCIWEEKQLQGRKLT
jgi:hypothetical protein